MIREYSVMVAKREFKIRRLTGMGGPPGSEELSLDDNETLFQLICRWRDFRADREAERTGLNPTSVGCIEVDAR